MYPDKSILEIASTCRFAHASHLGRALRRAYGMAPSAYAYRERQTPRAIGEIDGIAEPAERAATLGELFPNRSEFVEPESPACDPD